jgi:hypothetical protein
MFKLDDGLAFVAALNGVPLLRCPTIPRRDAAGQWGVASRCKYGVIALSSERP